MYPYYYYYMVLSVFMATASIVNGSWNTSVFFLNFENNPPYSLANNDLSGDTSSAQLIKKDNASMIELGFDIMIRRSGREKWRNFTHKSYRHQKRFKTLQQLRDFVSPNLTRSREDLYQQLNITQLNDKDIFIISAANHLVIIDERFFHRIKLFFVRKHVLVVPTESILMTKQFLHSFGQCINTLGTALIFAVNIAALIWLIEHKTNPDFDQNFGPGFGASIWFCVVTMTTVGYGDKVPKHFVSRLLVTVWMLFGLMLTAFITTNVMESVRKGMSKKGKIISCQEKTAAHESVPRMFDVTLHTTPSYQKAIDLVKSGTVDAAFVDSNVAAYYLANNDPTGYLKIESEYDITIPLFAFAVISDSHSLRSDFDENVYGDNYFGHITTQVLTNKYVPSYTVYPYYLPSFGQLFRSSDYVVLCLLGSCIVILIAAVVCEALRWSRVGSVVPAKNDNVNEFEGTEECQKMMTEMERKFQEMMLTMVRRVENDMRRQSKSMTEEKV